MGKEHHLVEASEAWDPEIGVPALETVGQEWKGPWRGAGASLVPVPSVHESTRSSACLQEAYDLVKIMTYLHMKRCQSKIINNKYYGNNKQQALNSSNRRTCHKKYCVPFEM